MQDRPTARELVEAVAGFLENEIIPSATDPRLKFRSLIAANVLSIVARELAAGDSDLHRERQRLGDLLGVSAADLESSPADVRSTIELLNRRLASAIRAGAFDEPTQFAAALTAAEDALVEKLQVTNPRYLARVRDQ